MNRVTSRTLVAVTLMAVSGCQGGGTSIQPDDAGTLADAPVGALSAADAAPDVGVPTNRYIVVFKRSPGVRGAAAATSAGHSVADSMRSMPGAEVVRVYRHALDAATMKLTPEGLAALRLDSRVAYIEPDAVVSINDVQPTPTWGLDRIDQRTRPLDASYAYPQHAGEGVHAYVIDTGVYAAHAQFALPGGASRLIPGYDFVDNDSVPDDCHGHGTHVAGTIGGSTWGVAKKVTLHSVRVLGCTGSGTLSNVIAGIEWVTANHVAPAVANMSLGGSYSQALNDAVTNAIAAGVTFAVAAGNSATDACLFSPASTPTALTVAASDINDTRATFSNLGTCVDLFAPGVAITSAWPGSPFASAVLDGTSMAAPHVAGAAALWLSLHPAATPADVAAALVGRATLNSVQDLGSGTPNRLLYTGELDGGSDLVAPSAVITAPPTGTTVTDVATVAVAASDESGPVTIVQLFVNGVARQFDRQEPWSLQWDAKDLPAGTYQLQAAALDASGNIGVSAPITVMLEHGLSPASVMLSPTGVVGGASVAGTVTLNQPAPAGGAIVALASSNTAVATVPATVAIDEGATSATFPISTVLPAVTTSVVVSATIGPVTRTATLTVGGPSRVGSLTLSAPSTPGGNGISGTVTLTQSSLVPITVALASDNPVAVVPATVTVAANALTASFAISTTPVSANTAAVITASYPASVTATATLTVTTAPPPTVNYMNVNFAQVAGGGSVTCTVGLVNPAPIGGALIPLTNSNPEAAIVPPSVFVPAGSAFASFTVATRAVASPSLASISATAPAGTTVTTQVTVMPPTLSAVAVAPNSLTGGNASTGTVTLIGAAPAGGALVTLTTANAAAALVPPTVTVPAGLTAVTFPITTFSVVTPLAVTVSASYAGRTVAVLLYVNPATPIALSAVTFTSSLVTGGTTTTGNAVLTQPALSGGAVVVLTSSNPSVATVPQSVTVNPGATSGPFLIQTTPQSADTAVTITATYGGVQRSSVLNISALPLLSSVGVNTTEVPGGTAVTGTIGLTRAAPQPMIVSLTSDNAAAVVPASVTVPMGASSTTFSISTVAVPTPVLATLTATIGSGVPRTAALTIYSNSPLPVSLVMNPTAVQAGQTSTATVTLNAPAPAGGAVLTLSTLILDVPFFRVVVAMPTTLTIPAGATTGTFSVVPNMLAGVSRTYINARMNGVTAQGFLDTVRTVIPGNAVMGPRLAPECGAVTALCDTGSLIDSRSLANKAAEIGTPNTINNSCRDGEYANSPGPPGNTFPWYHVDSSLDRLRIFTSDGSALAAGKTVTVEATVWSVGTGNNLEIFSAPDATNPKWTSVARLTTTASNLNVLSTTFTLPAGTLQAIRGVFLGVPLQPCAGGAFGAVTDYDDLVFATDNGGPPTNIAPIVNAGPDQIITLPPVANLSGSVLDDGLPNPPGTVTTTWTKVSGPGSVVFGDAAAQVTTATFSLPGNYVLRLSASDGTLSGDDTLAVAVNTGSGPNQPPSVDAGPDQTATFPGPVILAGAVTDDGNPNPPGATTKGWTVVSGPGVVTFDDAASLAPAVTFDAIGSYTLRLTADDGLASTADDVIITVAPPPNTAPAVNAGVDQTITLPAAATLAGTVSDDGQPNPPGAVTTAWTKVSGPGSVTFANAAAPSTTAAFSTAGVYTLRLAASDSELSATDDVVVTVNPPPNTAPVVNAGPDQTITLPAAATLAGTVSDDGQPNPPGGVTAAWTKVSGPGSVSFANPGAPATTATFTASGSYVLRLTGSDGALSATDTVAITVKPPTMKVQYHVAQAKPQDNHIKPYLDLFNTGAASIPLNQIRIRYWYTIDSQQPQTINCDYAQVGCSRITSTFVNVTPARPGADRYLEIGFTAAAGSLTAGGHTGLIQLRWNKNDWSDYNETNDYSYSTGPSTPAPTSFVDWSRITVYQNGTRIWGVEP